MRLTGGLSDRPTPKIAHERRVGALQYSRRAQRQSDSHVNPKLSLIPLLGHSKLKHTIGCVHVGHSIFFVRPRLSEAQEHWHRRAMQGFWKKDATDRVDNWHTDWGKGTRLKEA